MGFKTIYLGILILFAFTSRMDAKSLGNFKHYQQVTDKEVLIETTKGFYVLVSAIDDYVLKVSSLSPQEALELQSPKDILKNKNLNGSIYVEELDELMQITTTIGNGVAVKVNKKPLHFSYIDKTNNEVFFQEEKGVNFKKTGNQLVFGIEENENIELVTHNNRVITTNELNQKDTFSTPEIKEVLSPSNEICLVSDRGYAIVFESQKPHRIDFSKSEEIKITKLSEQSVDFSYLFIYGPEKPELIDRFAFHIATSKEQISQR